MINAKRIVPVTKSDLLTLYGNIIKLAGTSVSKVDATDIGIFDLASGSGNLIASEPVKHLNFGSSVSAAVVYFIPAVDFEGISINNTEQTVSVDADGSTLYTATLADSAVTVAKVGF